jgi:hypothetical protein
VKRKSKIQDDIQKEILEDYPSWWWRTKMTSEKVGGSRMYKFGKISNSNLINKGAHWWNYFYLGKEIKLWIGKDLIRILEGLINFIEDLIGRKIDF